MKKIFFILAMFWLSGCYQQQREYSVASNGTSFLAPAYGLVPPQAIINNMTSTTGLGLSTSNESPADIRTRRIELGDADPANRIFKNTKASPGKFKTIFENYINACSDSLGISGTPSTTQQAVRSRLFPQGVESVDQFFLTFTGRGPTAEERAALQTLMSGVAAQVRHAAACAAVLSSMEPLNGT